MRVFDRRLGFVCVVLATQLALPLWHHLAGDDPGDARFAWRMFSASHARVCEADFQADGRDVALSDITSDLWQGPVRRGRRAVIDGLARHLCRDHADVRVVLRCSDWPAAPETLDDGRRNRCQR